MIALMELAAAKAMRGLLGAGQLSVGVGVLYRFQVQALDRRGVVGEGHHTRAIISTDRLLSGALARNGRG
jgi:predicted thioesterase